MRPQLVGLVVAFLLIGGMAYYTYSVTTPLSQRNQALQREVAQLQSNLTRMQETLNLYVGREGLDASQIAIARNTIQAEQAALDLVRSELVSLGAQIGGLQSGNITAIRLISYQLQNISSSLQSLQKNVNRGTPTIFLRTFGTALASYVVRANHVRYLRLTANGPTSGAEAAIAPAFDASIAGNFIEWSAVANRVSADSNHWFWPMVLENSPGGTNALEFEQAGGIQEVAAVKNGVRTVLPAYWNATAPHIFKIVIVNPGVEVDFYIDGKLEARMIGGIPVVDFLLEGAEVKGTGVTAPGIAMLDVYGGLLGGA